MIAAKMFRIVALIFAELLGIGAASAEPPKKTDANPVAAIVNGEEIRLSHVDAYIKKKFALVPLTDLQLRQLRTEAIADLIDDSVLRQFLEKNAPKVETAEIDKQVEAFSESLRKKGKTFAEFLKETNQTEAELRRNWTILLQLDGYTKKTATEEQLKQYYAANKDYFDRVEVKASHIMLQVSSKASPIEKEQAREKLKLLKGFILAKKMDFATAAKKFSQCPSAPDGGDLGFIPRKGCPIGDAFAKAAFALKPGEISDVVESEFGVHLILVSERKPGQPSQYEKCVEEVRESYTDEHRAALIAKLRKEAKVTMTLP